MAQAAFRVVTLPASAGPKCVAALRRAEAWQCAAASSCAPGTTKSAEGRNLEALETPVAELALGLGLVESSPSQAAS